MLPYLCRSHQILRLSPLRRLGDRVVVVHATIAIARLLPETRRSCVAGKAVDAVHGERECKLTGSLVEGKGQRDVGLFFEALENRLAPGPSAIYFTTTSLFISLKHRPMPGVISICYAQAQNMHRELETYFLYTNGDLLIGIAQTFP